MRIKVGVFFLLFFSSQLVFALDGLTAIADGLRFHREQRISEMRQVALKCRVNLASQINNGTLKGGKLPLRAVVGDGVDTLRIESIARTFRDPKVQGRVLLLHGLGMEYSGPGSWNQFISTLSADSGKSGSTAEYLLSLEDYIFLAPEAIALPGSNVFEPLDYMATLHKGFWRRDTPTFDQVVDLIIRKLSVMKEESPDIPNYVIARSAYGRFLLEANYRAPGLIDKIVLINPTFPGGPALDRVQYAGAAADAQKDGTLLAHDVIKWYFEATKKVRWDRRAYFQNTPLLIFSGSKDHRQTPPAVRANFQKLVDEYPDIITYIDIEGAEHDVFNTNNEFKNSGREALREFFKFLKSES